MGDESGKFEVGYGKPPKAHQFKKGQSGNPKGRVKGSRNKVPTSTSLEFGSQPANQILLQEAYRTVTIREGEQVIQLPAIQAVFRAMGVSAMKGNRFAQRTIAELVQQIENEDCELRIRHIEAVMEYKTRWEENIEWAQASGITEELLPRGSSERVLNRLANNSHASPERLRVAEERLRVLDRFEHTGFIVGKGRFARYFGAKFGDTLVALENLEYGNTMYVFEQDWERLTQLSRTELIKRRDPTVHRVPHLQGWPSAIREILRAR